MSRVSSSTVFRHSLHCMGQTANPGKIGMPGNVSDAVVRHVCWYFRQEDKSVSDATAYLAHNSTSKASLKWCCCEGVNSAVQPFILSAKNRMNLSLQRKR